MSVCVNGYEITSVGFCPLNLLNLLQKTELLLLNQFCARRLDGYEQT